MWSFQSKRDLLRDRLLFAAPEANPHEFVHRYLQAKPRQSFPRDDRQKENRGQDRRQASRRAVDPRQARVRPV
jgi:hypothetical protein